jgi:hypothetical protein
VLQVRVMFMRGLTEMTKLRVDLYYRDKDPPGYAHPRRHAHEPASGHIQASGQAARMQAKEGTSGSGIATDLGWTLFWHAYHTAAASSGVLVWLKGNAARP